MPHQTSAQNATKARQFAALHRSGPFILANVWDAGTAKLMAALGAKSLATSSAAHAFTLGLTDGGQLSREEALAHANEINEATDLPVNGDFENGFGDDLDDVRETIRLSIDGGLAGCGIEDIRFPQHKPYAFNEAVARIEAAVDAKKAACAAHNAKFTLTARADGVMIDQYDLDEAIRRIQAFARAGADVVYVPMPKSFDDLKTIVKSVDVPVNALCAGPYTQYSVAAFGDIGVARVSLGSSLARVVHRVILDVAKPMIEAGDMTALSNSISGATIDELLASGGRNTAP
ncbi:isocitrate lyase/PEP mutase family protein [Maritalea mediterranea]|uniref:Isocitrate lyase/phosphoenolpyruvate mutase family protein n=1 Tax=Maritalea mediterranea TaxID=2909667 RepID=A0ABS9E7Y8_9HYPH|nr:isocitrate lyase/phosphoenolpyruvate mutase family protein [Maritalea mediterranea]MCF4098009.1 isocitrate lyase/phosphoenolpyruvate mutase family protein [Maritalea mediterranea]